MAGSMDKIGNGIASSINNIMNIGNNHEASDKEIIRIPVELVRLNPNNDYHIDEAFITDMADSMIEEGQITPGIVVEIDTDENGCEYQIIGGEQRYHAVKKAGLTHYEAYSKGHIDNYDPNQILKTMIHENKQRIKSVEDKQFEIAELEKIYEWEKKQGLIPKGLKKRKYVADVSGISQTTVQNIKSMDKLIESWKTEYDKGINNGGISYEKAVELARLSEDAQTFAYNQYLEFEQIHKDDIKKIQNVDKELKEEKKQREKSDKQKQKDIEKSIAEALKAKEAEIEKKVKSQVEEELKDVESLREQAEELKALKVQLENLEDQKENGSDDETETEIEIRDRQINMLVSQIEAFEAKEEEYNNVTEVVKENVKGNMVLMDCFNSISTQLTRTEIQANNYVVNRQIELDESTLEAYRSMRNNIDKILDVLNIVESEEVVTEKTT